ncbi:MAG: cobalamin biosynthesis protein CbiX [Candidatus Thiodiazotropha sp. (ex Gloverina cf. vestifex)]|nr:cobalamin biosynthesis protein CbiX [Candidatus Thiodiazotropha sp. (ex Gloverina cf. vestifex)]
MKSPTILLVDNGSSSAEATLNLRRLASALSIQADLPIHPVSLQHAEKIPCELLDGIPADTFTPFMKQRLALGEREFLLLPLFFGPSRALSAFIPDQVKKLQSQYGHFILCQTPALCPLPAGEPLLAKILCDQLATVSKGNPLTRVILVDHGSPMPEVTAVRTYLAEEMQKRLGAEVKLQQAVMERREGTAYDFNGELLEGALNQAAATDKKIPIYLSLLFLSPGRHAGSGGDIESICEAARQRHSGLPIFTSPLVGEHPELLDIFHNRLLAALKSPENIVHISG